MFGFWLPVLPNVTTLEEMIMRSQLLFRLLAKFYFFNELAAIFLALAEHNPDPARFDNSPEQDS